MAKKEPETVELTPQEEQRRIARLIAEREMAKLAEDANALKQQRAERGEIWVSKVIDPHEGRLATVTGSWQPLTPSLCQQPNCGYDAAKETGFKDGWDSIPEDMILPWNGKTAREHVEVVLSQHSAIAHPTAGAPSHIRTPEQARAARANRPVPDTFIENPRLG